MKGLRLTYSILLFFSLSLLIKPAFSQSNFYDINKIPEIRIYFKESNWEELLDSLFINYGEDGRLRGDIKIDGKLIKNVGVRYKGYSSWSSTQIKTPFNIDIEYNYNNQNYQGITKLKLGNVVGDPSFIREAVAYEIARKYMPSSYSNFANVYINDTLIGLYNNVEAVNKNFLKKRFDEGKNTFFKGSPETLNLNGNNNADLSFHGNDTSDYKVYYKLESDNSTTSWLDLVRLIHILNNDTSKLDSILNIDRAIWMHAFNYALVNLDSYIGYAQNYYLYVDENGRFNPILWDLNMSFGSFRETDGINFNISHQLAKTLNPLSMIVYPHANKRPLIENLLHNTTYKRMYLAHIRTIINENFKNNFYYNRGKELQNIIDESVQNDPNKFYSYANFLKNMDTTAVITSQNKIIGLKDLIQSRINYLDTFPGIQGAPSITNIIQEKTSPEQGSKMWIKTNVSGATEVFLGYRYKTNGVFKRVPMYDDGNHNDENAEDGIYGTNITVAGKTFQYYIYAQNEDAGIFSPERAEYEYYTIQPIIKQGDIVINEIMSINKGLHKDQNGQYEPWIELYNNTFEKINLKGYSFSDNSEEPNKWTFPDTCIDGKRFLIVWADQDTTQNGLHANFNLATEGGNLYFSNNTGQQIDRLKYSEQIANKTYGRYPNGYGEYVYMLPSYSKTNHVGTTPLTDCIIYPNPASNEIYIETFSPEFFKFYNIYDMNGGEIKSNEFEGTSAFNLESPTSSELYKINISDLNNGMYILRISTLYKTIFKKIIVFNKKQG